MRWCIDAGQPRRIASVVEGKVQKPSGSFSQPICHVFPITNFMCIRSEGGIYHGRRVPRLFCAAAGDPGLLPKTHSRRYNFENSISLLSENTERERSQDEWASPAPPSHKSPSLKKYFCDQIYSMWREYLSVASKWNSLEQQSIIQMLNWTDFEEDV